MNNEWIVKEMGMNQDTPSGGDVRVYTYWKNGEIKMRLYHEKMGMDIWPFTFLERPVDCAGCSAPTSHHPSHLTLGMVFIFLNARNIPEDTIQG